MIRPNNVNYLKEYTTDQIIRLIYLDDKFFSPNKEISDKITDIANKLNFVIQNLNLKVARNIPYFSIGILSNITDLTRIIFRNISNIQTGIVMLQVSEQLNNYFANISHIVDCFRVSGALKMEKSEYNMNAKISFDSFFTEMIIIDVFLDIAFFNSYSFLKELSSEKKKDFNKLKYEYFKNNKLDCVFVDESNGELDYYSFAFSCHNSMMINSNTPQYMIDYDKYIKIWDGFIRTYFPNDVHVEKSVEKQIELRKNDHIPNDYHERFKDKKPGVYFLIRTDKKNIASKYKKEVCSLFGIDECEVGKLQIIKQEDFNKYRHLFKGEYVSSKRNSLYYGAHISPFKVVVQ